MSKHPEDIERWRDNRREDGLSVVAGIDGWVIMPKAEGMPIDRCPCCNELFAKNDGGARAARLVADAMYPVSRGQ